MTEFTKEQLRSIAREERATLWSGLAAFALAQMERAEKDQRELVERGKDIHTLTCALESERLRAENAEAERDRISDEWIGAIGTLRAIGDAVCEEGDELKILAAVRTVAAERDRLKKELEEATARGPHYIRDSRLRAEGMRAAAEIARNLRPKDACTCGNYLSFRNGVPGHLPGCLVGECIEVADEIEGRAEEIDRSNRE